MALPTRSEADALVETPKIVTVLATWRPSDRYNRKLDVTVFVPDTRQLLRLTGTIGKRNYSFALLFNNYPIRKYTKHYSHRDSRTGERVRVPHKHTWDQDKADSEVYIPSDIDPDSDINEQFLAFCKECNIELLGGCQAVANI